MDSSLTSPSLEALDQAGLPLMLVVDVPICIFASYRSQAGRDYPVIECLWTARRFYLTLLQIDSERLLR